MDFDDDIWCFGRFYLREMIHDPVGITRIAFKDKIMGFRIKCFNK